MREMIDVVIPSYRRPEDLRRCLAGLDAQTRPAREVIVVLRADDAASRTMLAETRNPCRVVDVVEPGVIAAMDAGVRACTGTIVALIDDDAVPRSTWLEQMERIYGGADDDVVGVGGRDVVWHGTVADESKQAVVGQLSWYGKVIGNHHAGYGPRRDVDVLKGVNCSYRRTALQRIGFDHRLRGAGAQVAWEISLGLQLRASGGRLIYDPELVVDHYEARRVDVERVGETRTAPTGVVADAVYNETLAVLRCLSPIRKVAYILWAILLGTRNAPGLAQAARFLPSMGMRSVERFRASVRARLEAVRDNRKPGSHA